MSESTSEAVQPAAAPIQAGAALRQARESRGVALATLAATLKVPVGKLQALEDEDWQRLPDMVFARALAQSVCRTLQIDAGAILALLPQQKVAALQPRLGINEPMRERAVPSIFPTASAGGGGRWLWVLLLLIVLGGVVYGGLLWQKDLLQDDDAPAAHAQADEDAPLFPPSDEEGDEPSAVSLALAQPQPSSEESAAPAEAADPVASAPAPAEPASADAAVPVLRLQAKGATWVQVVDAQQRLLVEKILQEGEVFTTSAPRPLTVAIGKADQTTVEINGVPFDPRAKARDNVARFEVK
ncbi:helix-turn-helix domain-containing protein [Comamonas nitrativorans]|uniref:Helix-turn-helix domain-containing protein n=1 Tax=Comamonas nitrativorans TaxID=108437 RepID=A0ABV9GTE6_9BURK